MKEKGQYKFFPCLYTQVEILAFRTYTKILDVSYL